MKAARAKEVYVLISSTCESDLARLNEWSLQSLQEAIIRTSDIGGNFRSWGGEFSPKRCLDKTLGAKKL